MDILSYLAENFDLPILEWIAENLHCGFLDVQYFSQVFKKYTGKTPKEYRESLK